MSSLSLEEAGRSLLSVSFPLFFYLFHFTGSLSIVFARALLAGIGATSLKDHFAETAVVVVATYASMRIKDVGLSAFCIQQVVADTECELWMQQASTERVFVGKFEKGWV